jgi:hypothetical protein
MEAGPEFFKVIGIPILAGRTFETSDDFQSVIVISRSLAMKTYGRLDVIGQLFPQSGVQRIVVGVAGDARLRKDDSLGAPSVYLPLNPAVPDRELIIRARTDAQNLVSLLRSTAKLLDDRVIADANRLSQDFANRTTEI